MGKASRKMNKKKQKKIHGDTVKSLQDQLREYFEAENYAEVINTLALLVQEKNYDPEDLYKGAYSYFMLGDCQRAINMVNNVLNFSPAHLEARILLARICIMQEREQDGLAIFDFVLEHYGRVLTAEQKQDMEDVLEYYDRTGHERLAEEFPYIAQLFRQDEETAPAPQNVSAAEAGKSAEAEQAVEGVHTFATECEKAKDGDGEKEKAAVLAQNISVADKVRLLQTFAGGHFVAGDYEDAELLLEAAETLDASNPVLLKNLAVLAKRMGQEEKALAFAAKLPEPDFILLDFLSHEK